MKNFNTFNELGYSLTIDECMIKYNRRLKFKQFIKNKKVNFGVKEFLLCENKTRYYLQILNLFRKIKKSI